ncbi:MAG: hypothetical protein ACFFAO_04060 [Candidatus Hermodarchaeota archaeon]
MSRKLFFKCDLNYTLLIEKIIDRLSNFIRYNPDDLNKKILEKVVKGAISEITDLSIDEIDKIYQDYAKIRVYFGLKDGLYLKTDFLNIFLPDLTIDELDERDAENCFIKAFFSKMNELIIGENDINQLIIQEKYNKLRNIFKASNEYALYATTYKLVKKHTPNKKELELFMRTKK